MRLGVLDKTNVTHTLEAISRMNTPAGETFVLAAGLELSIRTTCCVQSSVTRLDMTKVACACPDRKLHVASRHCWELGCRLHSSLVCL